MKFPKKNIFNRELFIGKHPLNKGVASVTSTCAGYAIQNRPIPVTPILIIKSLRKERRKTFIRI